MLVYQRVYIYIYIHTHNYPCIYTLSHETRKSVESPPGSPQSPHNRRDGRRCPLSPGDLFFGGGENNLWNISGLGNYGYLMGKILENIGKYRDFMGNYRDFMGNYRDLMGKYGELIHGKILGFHGKILGIHGLQWEIMGMRNYG